MLLDQILQAHGGTDRWAKLSTVTGQVAYGGPFWEFKGHADFASTETFEADLHSEHIRQVDQATGRVIVFDKKKDRVSVTAADGTLLDELTGARATFDGFTPETQWSTAQIAYFRSYATWHYLTEPFLFTWPGVEVEEVEPWTEEGQTWRVLRVTFPDSLATHSRTQFYYFDDAYLLRRMDYEPEVNGRTPVAHYIRQAGTFDGIVVPTQRHVLTRLEDRTPDLSWIPITLDLDGVKFH